MEQLIKLPVNDVKLYPEINSQSIKYIIDSLEVILSKCLYCIRQQVACGLEVFIFALLQAATVQTEKFCKALMVKKDETSCLDFFYSITEQILSATNRNFRLQLDVEMFFELLQIVCGSIILKDKVGGPIGTALIKFMMNRSLHQDDYRVHRNCASTFITILRGSKANKNKFSVEVSNIAKILQESSDFFFQMQCAEILFRLYTHNKTILAHAEMDDQLRQGISDLPNDATLLLNIQSLLDRYNSEINNSQIMPFTIIRMEVDGVEICGHTTMYFSDVLLVVLLPGGNSDNFTIPFEHIRSVKLSKDHRLGLRLNQIPPKLSSVMDVDNGSKDTIHVFLTQSVLQRIRSCGIHEWIANRKRTAPLRVQQSHIEEVKNVNVSVSSGHNTSSLNHTNNITNLSSEKENSRSTATAQGSSWITERHSNVASNASSNVNSRKMSRQRGDESDLDEIHRAASIKVSRHRQEQLTELQAASDQIHQSMEDMRHLNARDRDALEVAFRNDMAAVRRAEAELKESASLCVNSLNTELEDIQALGALLKGEVDKLREKVAKAVGRSEGVEEASLLSIKQLVDRNVKEMEQTLTELVVKSNPLVTVNGYIAQKTSGN